MTTTLSPIILFVYNRPDHVQRGVASLLANELASQSDLYIYSDAPKNEDAKEAVEKVREYIHTVKGLGIVSKAEIDVFLELSYPQIRTRHCTGR